MNEAWHGPARLDLVPHVNCPLADLPVRHILSGENIKADVTRGTGAVLKDYLRDDGRKSI